MTQSDANCSPRQPVNRLTLERRLTSGGQQTSGLAELKLRSRQFAELIRSDGFDAGCVLLGRCGSGRPISLSGNRPIISCLLELGYDCSSDSYRDRLSEKRLRCNLPLQILSEQRQERAFPSKRQYCTD